MVPIVSGDIYDAETVQKAIDALTNAAGTKGYAFAEVHPRIARNRDSKTIDLIFDIDQGPRVYIGKINITGNTRTLDKVIRREFRLVEGDAFNRVLVDRSRTRIRGLGFFKDVDVKNTPGSPAGSHRCDGGGHRTIHRLVAIGPGLFLGQPADRRIQLYRAESVRPRPISEGRRFRSRRSPSIYQFSFTEPYFLDRPLAAGFDIYKSQTDYQQATYSSDTTGVHVPAGLPDLGIFLGAAALHL